MVPEAGECRNISPGEELCVGGKGTGALARPVLLPSPGLRFSSSAEGEPAGADGQGRAAVPGAELAAGVQGLARCSDELLSLTVSLMVSLLSHSCAALAEPRPGWHLLEPSHGVKASLGVSRCCSPQSLLPWAPATLGFELN